jgi:putative membrane protein insertion efficiency factor
VNRTRADSALRAPLHADGVGIRRKLVHGVSLLPRFVGIGLIWGYRVTFGWFLGGQCKYHPSCSQYAIDALRQKGLVRGSALAGWRLLRCNPWSRGGFDPVR